LENNPPLPPVGDFSRCCLGEKICKEEENKREIYKRKTKKGERKRKKGEKEKRRKGEKM
jgi:hypothetical protein